MEAVATLIARRKRQDRIFSVVGVGCTMLGIVTLAVLLGNLAYDGLTQIDWQFLTFVPVRFADQAGILSPWVGSLIVMIGHGRRRRAARESPRACTWKSTAARDGSTRSSRSTSPTSPACRRLFTA